MILDYLASRLQSLLDENTKRVRVEAVKEHYASDMFDSYEDKLWSTAVQKCFEAPFVEVAVQYLVRRAYEKGKAETKIDNLPPPKTPTHGK